MPVKTGTIPTTEAEWLALPIGTDHSRAKPPYRSQKMMLEVDGQSTFAPLNASNFAELVHKRRRARVVLFEQRVAPNPNYNPEYAPEEPRHIIQNINVRYLELAEDELPDLADRRSMEQFFHANTALTAPNLDAIEGASVRGEEASAPREDKAPRTRARKAG